MIILLKTMLDLKGIQVVSEMCCSSLGFLVCRKCENVFCQWNEWKRGRWREWQQQTPCGMENMSGTGVHLCQNRRLHDLCCSFFCTSVSVVRLLYCIISSQSTFLFLSIFFSVCHALFSPQFSFACPVSGPLVSPYFNPIYVCRIWFTIRNSPTARVWNVNTVNAFLILNMLV